MIGAHHRAFEVKNIQTFKTDFFILENSTKLMSVIFWQDFELIQFGNILLQRDCPNLKKLPDEVDQLWNRFHNTFLG